MDWKSFTFLGVGAAAIIPFWQQIRGFVTKIFAMFWKQRIVPYPFGLTSYTQLRHRSKVINFDDYDLDYEYWYHVNKKQKLPSIIKQFKFEIFLYKNFIPIIISGHQNKIKISYLKYTFDFDLFLEEMSNIYYQDLENFDNNVDRFAIFRRSGQNMKSALSANPNKDAPTGVLSSKDSGNNNTIILNNWDVLRAKLPFTVEKIGNLLPYAPNDQSTYIFTKQGNYVCNQVKKWLQSEKWYNSKNIRWYRGCLLYSKPGNGKSTLILEIAKKLKIPIYIYDLSTMVNQEFEENISSMSTESGIVLFEDFDNIFNGRDNITKTDKFGGLTFDCFINKLSGVDAIKNKFVFITTNCIDKIDSAILRPGRCDDVIEIESLNAEEKLRLAQSIIDRQDDCYRIVEEGKNDTTAAFENRCVREALTRHWNK